MSTFRSILDGLREFALTCIGSPHSRTRQLAALRRLDAHLLRDIGLTAEEAARAVSHHAGPRPDATRQAPQGRIGQASLTR
jgi:uncharacterized protein YjiS (DUF1127 family)